MNTEAVEVRAADFDTGALLTPRVIRDKRRLLRLTQAEIARQLGVAPNTVARWERGEMRPSHPEVMARRLGRLQHAANVGLVEGPTDEKLAWAATPKRHRGNLPAELSSFVGRREEIRELVQLLQRTRLLALTGTGGVGKTRLAVRLAAAVLPKYRDGAWLVDLAPLAALELVPQALAVALGVREEQRRPILETLADSLRGRHLLLILDNCEHLVAACANVAERLLRACPHLRILATSREPLGVEGEFIRRVPSLPLPTAPGELGLQEIADSEAVQLFVDRARAVEPQFSLGPDNASTVAAVCNRLDGIPLALELAAARIAVLPPSQLLARLDNALDVLVGRTRTVLPRQRTLRATLEWSYQLLAPEARQLLNRLSVFAGSWTLDTAEAICSGHGVERPEVLDTLTQLIERSMVVVLPTSGTPRYRLLETVRQFANQCLLAEGAVERWKDRHAAHFLRLAEETESKSWGPKFTEWRACLEPELDNVRAALRWLIQSGEVQAAQRLGAALARLWKVGNLLHEGQAWLAELRTMPGGDAPTLPRSRILTAAGELMSLVGAFDEGRPLLVQALELCRRLGDTAHLVVALWSLAHLEWWNAKCDAARELGQEALVLSRQAGLRIWEGQSLYLLAGVADSTLDYTAARGLAEQCLEVNLSIGYQRGIAVAQQTLGRVYYRMGDLVRARDLLEAGLPHFRNTAWPYGVAWNLVTLGWIATDERKFGHARACLEEAMRTFGELRADARVPEALEAFAQLAEAEGHPRKSIRLAAAAAALRDNAAIPLSPMERQQLDPRLQRARRALGVGKAIAAWAEGRRLTAADATAEALSGATRSTLSTGSGALTEREIEVATYVASGLSSKRVAEVMVIAQRTVETHLEHIYAKLDVHSRAQLATRVAQGGLLWGYAEIRPKIGNRESGGRG